ncbi:MAG: nucleotidyltransferase family protein [Alphaproteobacteria bacterium]|nr:nucleotidyltransferase family protein [Alphaproteobacteria bacterium]
MQVAAIILAAGSSRRFGEPNKLLAGFSGRPLIRIAVDCALRSGATEVLVVIRPNDSGVAAAIADLPVRVLVNPQHAEGIGASIACAVSCLPQAIDGALIMPADMPWMEPALLDALIARFDEAKGDAIVYPVTAGGKQRNPVLWPRRHFRDLWSLDPGRGARTLISASNTLKITVKTGNDRVFRDIDSPEDLPG